MQDNANSDQTARGGGRGRGRGTGIAALEARIQAIETASLAPTQVSEITTPNTTANQTTGAGSGFGRGIYNGRSNNRAVVTTGRDSPGILLLQGEMRRCPLSKL